MKDIVFGVFTTKENAEEALRDLRAIGIPNDSISIIMKDNMNEKEIVPDTEASLTGGAVTGAATGILVGALTGLLISVGAITIPGIGGIVIVGPIAALLGISTTAAATLSGAAGGALAGGFAGALLSLGLSKNEAEFYENVVKNEGIIIAISSKINEEDKVKDVLVQDGAEHIKIGGVK